MQRDSEGKLTFFFDPSENPSTKQEQFEFLKRSGGDITDEMAAGIVGGRFVVLADPVTREGGVFDKATGERITAAPTAPTPSPTPGVVTPDTDPTTAVGAGGFLRNAVNIVTDSIGAGQFFEDTQQATTALNVIQQQTKLLLQSVVPGRPAKDIREGLEKLTVTPNSLFKGEVGAKSALEGTKRLIDNEIARMQNMLQTTLSPTDRATLEANLGPLQEMSRSHQDLIDGFDKKSDEPVPEGITGEAAELWPWMTPEARARALKAAGQ